MNLTRSIKINIRDGNVVNRLLEKVLLEKVILQVLLNIQMDGLQMTPSLISLEKNPNLLKKNIHNMNGKLDIKLKEKEKRKYLQKILILNQQKIHILGEELQKNRHGECLHLHC